MLLQLRRRGAEPFQYSLFETLLTTFFRRKGEAPVSMLLVMYGFSERFQTKDEDF